MSDVCGWRTHPGAQLAITVGRYGGFKLKANRQKIGLMLGWVLIQIWFFDKSEWDRRALTAVCMLNEMAPIVAAAREEGRSQGMQYAVKAIRGAALVGESGLAHLAECIEAKAKEAR